MNRIYMIRRKEILSILIILLILSSIPPIASHD
jgi:hypothetical protein